MLFDNGIGWTQERIAEELGVTQQTVSNALQKIPRLEKFVTPPESLQVYDVWNFAKLNNERRRGGNEMSNKFVGQIEQGIRGTEVELIREADEFGYFYFPGYRATEVELIPIHISATEPANTRAWFPDSGFRECRCAIV